LSGKASL